jgi:hypothetical protein
MRKMADWCGGIESGAGGSEEAGDDMLIGRSAVGGNRKPLSVREV